MKATITIDVKIGYGTRLRIDGEDYIIAQIYGGVLKIISLLDGNRFNNYTLRGPLHLKDITIDEFHRLFQPTFNWDRLQIHDGVAQWYKASEFNLH